MPAYAITRYHVLPEHMLAYPAYASILWHMLTHASICFHMLAYANMSHKVRADSNICQHMLAYAGVVCLAACPSVWQHVLPYGSI